MGTIFIPFKCQCLPPTNCINLFSVRFHVSELTEDDLRVPFTRG